MIGKLDDYLRFNQAALNLRASRQEVITSNMANADTPNYKARDFDFASALQNATGASVATSPAATPASQLATTDAAHFARAGQDGDTLADGTPLQYRRPLQGSVDGNTVDMDVERGEMADNSVRYEAAITAMNGQIRSMLAAIQGGQ